MTSPGERENCAPGKGSCPKNHSEKNIEHVVDKMLVTFSQCVKSSVNVVSVVYCRIGLFLLDDTHRVDVCAFYLNMRIQNIIQWVLFSRALTC